VVAHGHPLAHRIEPDDVANPDLGAQPPRAVRPGIGWGQGWVGQRAGL